MKFSTEFVGKTIENLMVRETVEHVENTSLIPSKIALEITNCDGRSVKNLVVPFKN